MKAIAAVNQLGYIGLNGKLPWRSSADFKHFKEKTKGGIMVVGKTTYEHDLGGKDLPGREMIIVGSGQPHYFPTLWEAIAAAVTEANARGSEGGFDCDEEMDPTIRPGQKNDIWVIGGASIYDQLWPLITELHLSVINDDTEGDRKLNIPEDFRGTIHKYYFEPNKKETV